MRVSLLVLVLALLVVAAANASVLPISTSSASYDANVAASTNPASNCANGIMTDFCATQLNSQNSVTFFTFGLSDVATVESMILTVYNCGDAENPNVCAEALASIDIYVETNQIDSSEIANSWALYGNYQTIAGRTPVYSGGIPSDYGTVTYEELNVVLATAKTGQFVTIVSTGGSTMSGFGLAMREVEVFGKPQLPIAYAFTNAQGSPLGGSSSAPLAIDGSLSTVAVTPTSGESSSVWMQFDLGTSTLISGIRIRPNNCAVTQPYLNNACAGGLNGFYILVTSTAITENEITAWINSGALPQTLRGFVKRVDIFAGVSSYSEVDLYDVSLSNQGKFITFASDYENIAMQVREVLIFGEPAIGSSSSSSSTGAALSSSTGASSSTNVPLSSSSSISSTGVSGSSSSSSSTGGLSSSGSSSSSASQGQSSSSSTGTPSSTGQSTQDSTASSSSGSSSSLESSSSSRSDEEDSSSSSSGLESSSSSDEEEESSSGSSESSSESVEEESSSSSSVESESSSTGGEEEDSSSSPLSSVSSSSSASDDVSGTSSSSTGLISSSSTGVVAAPVVVVSTRIPVEFSSITDMDLFKAQFKLEVSQLTNTPISLITILSVLPGSIIVTSTMPNTTAVALPAAIIAAASDPDQFPTLSIAGITFPEPVPQDSSSSSSLSAGVIAAIVIASVLGLALVSVACYGLRRKRDKPKPKTTGAHAAVVNTNFHPLPQYYQHRLADINTACVITVD